MPLTRRAQVRIDYVALADRLGIPISLIRGIRVAHETEQLEVFLAGEMFDEVAPGAEAPRMAYDDLLELLAVPAGVDADAVE